MNRALAASRRLLESTWYAVEAAEDRAARCPLRTSRDLQRLAKRLGMAMNRLERAVNGLRETTDSMVLEERIPNAPQILTTATARWLQTALELAQTSDYLFAVHDRLFEDVMSGEVVPEAEGPRPRPRIVTVPRLIFARDFLLCRRKSAHDRISSLRARRRRTTTRPAADAPRRISRGRAPPLVSTSLL